MQTVVSSKDSNVPHANKCKSLSCYLDSQSNKLDQGSSINSSIVSRMVISVHELVSSKMQEFKHDVYGRGQTAKITFDFLFFSCNPSLNHTNMEECLLLFTANTNIFSLLYRQLETEDKSSFFLFAVRRNVMLHLSDRVVRTLKRTMHYALCMYEKVFSPLTVAIEKSRGQ